MECPICNNKTKPIFNIPFGKNCENLPIKDKTLIEYHQCTMCDYIFAPEFLQWTEKDFKDKIYNEDYIIYDPDFNYLRPYNSMKEYYNILKEKKHLDYGSGKGIMSQLLRNVSIDSTSYDIFYNVIRPKEKYDIVTCIEVIEHSVNPIKIFNDIHSLLNNNGELYVSTLIMDNIKDIKNNWYISPRNGHIGFYFNKTLKVIAEKTGFMFINNTRKTFIKIWKEE